MSVEDEIKVEGSIPAQARVNIMSLANLDLYWTSEGYQIRSMSQLIGFSIELLSEILESNRRLKQKIGTIAQASRYLMKRGLYQKSMHKRGHKKLGMAIAFEGMRAEGMRPESYAPEIYNRMHRGPDHNGNPTTVQPFTGKVDSEEFKRGVEILNNLPENREHSVLDELSGMPFEVGDKTNKTGGDKVVRSREHDKIVNSEDAADFERRLREDTPPLKEKGNSPELIQARIKKADKEAQIKLDELNNFNPMSLMGSAVKEKIV